LPRKINIAKRAYGGFLRNDKENSIKFEEFYEISQMPCTYCGMSYSNTFNEKNFPEYNFNYNGLDRVHNEVGHVIGNVIASCRYCNTMKSDLFIKEFDDWITTVHNNLQTKELPNYSIII
jgi:hypothetical protein